MLRRHRILAIVIFAVLLALPPLLWRAPAPGQTTPCVDPVVVEEPNRRYVVCAPGPRTSARDILTRLGHRCAARARRGPDLASKGRRGPDLASKGRRGPDLASKGRLGPWLKRGQRLIVGARCGVRVAQTSGALRLLLGLAIDVNRAAEPALRALPRIGKTLARRIVRERRRGGPYASMRSLARRVRGIGPKTVQSLNGLAEVFRSAK